MVSLKLTCVNKSVKHKRLVQFSLLGLLSILLVGCTTLYDPESSQELHTDAVVRLESNQVVTQLIHLPQDSLSSITFWAAGEGTYDTNTSLRISIYKLGKKPRFIYTASLSYPVPPHQTITLVLPKNVNIQKGDYAFILQAGGQPVWLYGCYLNCYPGGSLTFQGTSLDNDLAFSLRFSYTCRTFIQDLPRAFQDIWLVIPIIAFFFAPGFFLISILLRNARWRFSTLFYLSCAISLSLYPLLLSWTTIALIKITPLLVKIFLYAILIFTLVRSRSHHKRLKVEIDRFDVLIFLVFVFALVLRLIMVRNLVAPPWVDSVHHALLVRLIQQLGGYPHSYQPFLSVETASYHSGFHAMVAFFTWVTGLSLPKAMLLFGQILNALTVYSGFVFARKFYPNRTIGLYAGWIIAVISPMPAYLTSWGRYTHLAGLFLLPAALFFFSPSDFSQRFGISRQKYTRLFVFALLSSALIIVHYRVSLFLAILLLLIFLNFLLKRQRQIITPGRIALLVYLSIATLLILFLSLPWLPQALASLILPKFRAPLSAANLHFESIPYNLLTFNWGWLSFMFAAIGLGIGILQKNRSNFIIALWVMLCFGTAYSQIIGISPILVNSTSVTISMYLPIAAVGGYGMHWLFNIYPLKNDLPQQIGKAIIIIFLFGLSLIASPKMISILNPITFLVRQDDINAMSWIRQNIPASSRILIHPFLWGYGMYAGNDGGSWIPALADRVTVPPPVLYGLTENKADLMRIQLISQRTLEYRNQPSELANWMALNQLDYLYVGGRGGEISPWLLQQSQNFRIVYHQDSVYILAPVIPKTHP
jgi:hypothetical protein